MNAPKEATTDDERFAELREARMAEIHNLIGNAEMVDRAIAKTIRDYAQLLAWTKESWREGSLTDDGGVTLEAMQEAHARVRKAARQLRRAAGLMRP